jgi:hypothetical protein
VNRYPYVGDDPANLLDLAEYLSLDDATGIAGLIAGGADLACATGIGCLAAAPAAAASVGLNAANTVNSCPGPKCFGAAAGLGFSAASGGLGLKDLSYAASAAGFISSLPSTLFP